MRSERGPRMAADAECNCKNMDLHDIVVQLVPVLGAGIEVKIP